MDPIRDTIDLTSYELDHFHHRFDEIIGPYKGMLQQSAKGVLIENWYDIVVTARVNDALPCCNSNPKVTLPIEITTPNFQIAPIENISLIALNQVAAQIAESEELEEGGIQQMPEREPKTRAAGQESDEEVKDDKDD